MKREPVIPGAAGTELSEAEIRNLELEILDDLHSFCEKHKLRMWLAYGTLLGAIRHGGMIPWDDDVDVVMPSEDYLKLIDIVKTLPNMEISTNRRFVCPDTDSRSSTIFGKVIDTRTVTAEERLEIAGIESVQGVWVDVFPLYGVCQSALKQRFGFWIFQFLFLSMRLSSWKKYTARTWWGRFAHSVLRFPAKLIGFSTFSSWASRFLKAWFPKFDSSQQVFTDSDMDTHFSREIFSKTTLGNFEGKRYPIPADYEAFLSAQYGPDYMTPLPPSERVTHEMNARWR